MTWQTHLHWLDGGPMSATNTTVGVPWPRGVLADGTAVRLCSAAGEQLPTQSWPLAFWPDGSVKWLGVAGVVGPDDGDALTVEVGDPPWPPTPVRVTRLETAWQVDTGAMRCDVGDRGSLIIRLIERDGGWPCRGLQLVCRLLHRREDAGRVVTDTATCIGVIRQVAVEQSGPVRAVLKVEGDHRTPDGRVWLPFVLRLAFFAGQDTVHLAHTIIYDGQPDRGSVAGLGVECRVPLRDDLQNRHVRVAGEHEVWAEPVRSLPFGVGMGRQYPLEQVEAERARQLRGEPVPASPDAGALPAWNNYSLWQDSPDHVLLRKRLGERFCWIEAAHGHRAPGALGISDQAGGLALGITDFWQSCPSALDIAGAASPEATVTAWLWAPDSPAMDLRHYADRHHRPFYETANPDPETYSSALGVARTSTLHLWAIPPGADPAAFAAFARHVERPPRLVCAPEHYHACGVFGTWALPDRATAARRALEDELDRQLDFYRDEVETRRWYGFWHYGDVMHTYDQERHGWRYDVGGYAWQNSEDAADIWLWYSFLRTGRADVFQLAAAMTRHVSEVDCHHLGPFSGLGSRHNVVHWGCACKQPRISQAAAKRFLYYLTADERTGDLLWEVVDADRHAAGGVAVAPGWDAFCANWMTAWERGGDTRYRERMLRGITGILAAPHRLLSGPGFSYDPETGALCHTGAPPSNYMLMTCFGAPETWFELLDVLPHDGWADALAEFGALYLLDPSERGHLPGEVAAAFPGGWIWPGARFAAFAAVRLRRPDLAARAWRALLTRNADDGQYIPTAPRTATHPFAGAVREMQTSTNCAAQWSLNVIGCLALIGDQLPEAGPPTRGDS
jgi:hypothetical protein